MLPTVVPGVDESAGLNRIGGYAPHTPWMFIRSSVYLMQLTSRDRFLLDRFTRYHLTARLVQHLSYAHDQPFTSLRGAQRRLKELVDNGYLKRQRLVTSGGEHCYFLTRKAARLVFTPDELDQVKSSRVLFSGFPPSQEQHNLAISRFMVKLERDVADAGIEFPLFVRDGHFTYSMMLDGKPSMLRPDGTMVLVQGGTPALFFLEVDLSTEKLETIRPNARNTRSFAEKIQKYTMFRREYPTITLGPHVCPGFRVLTVCKTQKRLENLVALAGRMGKQGMFQFLTMAQYLNQDEEVAQSFQGASLLYETGFTTPSGPTTLYSPI